MNKKLESIIKKGKIAAAAGVASVVMGCASMVHYVEPKIGAIIPVAAEQKAQNAALTLGADYGFYLKNVGVGVEAGLDYFHSEADFIKTDSILPRASINFSPFELGLQDVPVKPYVAAGVSLLNEFSKISIPQYNINKDVSNSTLGIDLNLGATLFDRINLKLGYTFLPSSKNVKGLFTVTGSYRFLFGK